MLTFLTGFIASMAHVVTGPDHLAAVTPLAIDSRKHSWKIGLAWGTGHTIGMLLIGALFILFKEILPVEAISKHSDTFIGFLLIGIGSWRFSEFIFGTDTETDLIRISTTSLSSMPIRINTHTKQLRYYLKIMATNINPLAP